MDDIFNLKEELEKNSQNRYRLEKELATKLREVYPIVWGILCRPDDAYHVTHIEGYWSSRERCPFRSVAQSGSTTWSNEIIAKPSDKVSDSVMLELDSK